MGQALVEAADKARQALESPRIAQETSNPDPSTINTLQTKRPTLSLRR